MILILRGFIMKKHKKYLISILLILSILLLSSCGMSNNNGLKESNENMTDTDETNDLNEDLQNTETSTAEKLSIKICGYSDSIPGISHELEYQDWSKNAFIDQEAQKSVSFTIDNIAVTGSYVETEKRFSEFYNTHKYKDENSRYFSLTEDGKLCTYFFGNNSSDNKNKQIYTEAECINIASEFISNITDVSQYTVTAVFNDSRKMYTVSFVKYADGFRCSDRADIMIDETGYIYSFSSAMLGRISSTATTKFDSKKVQEQVISSLDNEYSKAKQSYDKVVYEDFDYELTVDGNGEYALICSVKVACTNSYGEYEAIDSELIQLLIR